MTEPGLRGAGVVLVKELIFLNNRPVCAIEGKLRDYYLIGAATPP